MNTQVRAISVPGPISFYLNDLMKESAIALSFMVWRPRATPFVFLRMYIYLLPSLIRNFEGRKNWGGFGVSVNKLFTGEIQMLNLRIQDVTSKMVAPIIWEGGADAMALD
jgi:hypothetical protein